MPELNFPSIPLKFSWNMPYSYPQKYGRHVRIRTLWLKHNFRLRHRVDFHKKAFPCTSNRNAEFFRFI